MQANDQPKSAPTPQPSPLHLSLDLVGSDVPSGIATDQGSKKEQKLFGEPKRREELRQAVHIALVIALRVAVVLFIVVFAVRVLHFILPENNAANAGKWVPHGWLSEAQLGAIDKFAFGALGTVVAQFVRNMISKDR